MQSADRPEAVVSPAASPAPTALADWIRRTQNQDGGWGSRALGASSTEPTSLALLALSVAPRDATIARGLGWLHAHQREDGAWPPFPSAGIGSWMTPLAIVALGRFDRSSGHAIRGAEWLLEQEGRSYPWLVKLYHRLFPEREAVRLDPDLTGWPWSPNTFSWVEPTAYALLALKTLSAELPRDRTTARIAEGERMVLDRMCKGGGWNYGNSWVLGEELWPYPDTTALALLALQDRQVDGALRASVAALERMLEENHSALATSLGILALQLYGRDVARLRRRLTDELPRVIAAGEMRTISLAALALETRHRAFAVPA